MANSYFVFAGRTSLEMGLIIERFPAQNKPTRKVTTLEVPGRNGLLRIDLGGYNNIPVSYDCYFRGGPDKAAEIASWLYGSGSGYLELRDTYRPGGYRLAAFDGPLDIDNVWNRHGRLTVTFDCKPEFFLDCGQNPITYTPDPEVRTFTAVLRNPYNFTAKPLLQLTGNGACSINMRPLGGTSVGSFTLSDLPGTLTVDCDTQNVYQGLINYNNLVSHATAFPELFPGDNEIVIAGQTVQTVSKMVLTPRWWCL